MRVLPPDPGARLIVWSDGAARGNPGPAGIGAVVATEAGRVLAEVSRGIGIATNNVAEYRAAIAGVAGAAALGGRRLLLRADSRLLIEQLAGRWRIRNPALIRLHIELRRLLERFDDVAYEHVRREFNREADRLANKGVDEWLAGRGRDRAADPPEPELFGPDGG